MSLDQLFNQFLGGQPAQQNQAPDQQASNSGGGGLAGLASGIPGGLAGGLAAGGLAGLLMGNKKVRKTAGKVAGGVAMAGGAAALGTLAYKAYQNWQSNSGTPPPPQNNSAAPQASRSSVPAVASPSADDFDPQQQVASDGKPFQLALVKAMIAAANADGHIDAKEQKAVFHAIGKMDLEADDKALIFDTLQDPPSVDTIAAYATGFEQASEIYMVSRLAIDPDHPAEKAYLDGLAERMSLPQDLVQHLENQLMLPNSEAA